MPRSSLFAVRPALNARSLLVASALALWRRLRDDRVRDRGAVGSGWTSTPASTPVPRNVEPPPPNVNLSGFPLPYRQGYADGCASATGPERKDSTRFAARGNYRTGWQDGLALCRKK